MLNNICICLCIIISLPLTLLAIESTNQIIGNSSNEMFPQVKCLINGYFMRFHVLIKFTMILMLYIQNRRGNVKGKEIEKKNREK